MHTAGESYAADSVDKLQSMPTLLSGSAEPLLSGIGPVYVPLSSNEGQPWTRASNSKTTPALEITHVGFNGPPPVKSLWNTVALNKPMWANCNIAGSLHNDVGEPSLDFPKSSGT